VIRFDSNELGMTKRIYVHLPKNYDQRDDYYPVVYLHDGQNLFDDKTAYRQRGWRLMDVLAAHPELPDLILVGIESDGKSRTDQLVPYPFVFPGGTKEMGGNADAYLEFVTQTVKPWIDATFRTLKSRKHTAMMGSSFGGVNSLYAMITQGHAFGRFASLSGAFQFGFYEPLLDRLQAADLSHVRKVYLDTGTMETDDEIENKRYLTRNRAIRDVLREKLDESRFRYEEIEDGIHHESAWEERVPAILRYLFDE
jgi:predicted alpha/beta superfamily hydrolase